MGLFSLFSKKGIVYFPDATTFHKYNAGFQTYKKIFDRLDIPYEELENNLSSGNELYESGYEQLARKIAQDNFQILQKKGVKKIITNSPECFRMLSQIYPQLVPQWDITVENIWAILFEE